MRPSVCAIASCILLVMTAVHAPAQQPPQPSPSDIAGEALESAQKLFDSGKYEECLEVVTRTIGEYETGGARYPWISMSRIYGLSALLAYTFRESGYETEVDMLLRKALVLNPDLDLGNPAVVPPFVLDRLVKARSAYLAQFSRSVRRNALGLFCALVLEPTVLQNPLLLQPGIAYTFNLSNAFSVDAELRFPLQFPIWNSIRGQVGVVWYPSFQIEKISTGISFSYMFGLDNLTTFMHSLSLGGRGEFVLRSGLGFAANAELLRVNLIIGTNNVPQPPSYSNVPFLGLFQVVFANINIYVFYTF
jgi:hypothetical protein